MLSGVSGEKTSSIPVFTCTFSFILQSSTDCAHFKCHKIFYENIFIILNSTRSVDNQDSISSEFQEMPCHPSLPICLCLFSPGANTKSPLPPASSYPQKSPHTSNHDISTAFLIPEHQDWVFKIRQLGYSFTLLLYKFLQINAIPVC